MISDGRPRKLGELVPLRKVRRTKPPSGGDDEPIFDLKNPLPVARWMAKTQYSRIIHHLGTFLEFNGAFYQQVSIEALRAKIYLALEQHLDNSSKPLKLHARAVSDIVDALRGVAPYRTKYASRLGLMMLMGRQRANFS